MRQLEQKQNISTRQGIKGMVHSFETGSSIDGPGIRGVIFLQGCPLRCKYCHNPDTWNMADGKEYYVQDVLKKVLDYKTFYEASGGGITVSGGEPLLQKEFLIELLKRLKSYNIHTAIDTSGFADIDEKLDEILEYTDLVLLDIKQLYSHKHIYLTGQPNDKTLNLLNYLNKNRIKTWIRYVVVKSINDSNEYAEEFAKFVRTFHNVELVELLPYHRLGINKWKNLGIKYPFKDIQQTSKLDIERIKGILNKHNVRTI